jgi:hypothetical protein
VTRPSRVRYASLRLPLTAALCGLEPLAPYGTYMGDPPPGLSVRGAFFGRKSDKEVCGGVVSVVSESSSRGR